MNSAKKDICSSLSQAKILLGLIFKAKIIYNKSIFFSMVHAESTFSHLRTQVYNPGHTSYTIASLNHTNICVMMEIHYQSVFCYADFLGEGKEGNCLVSETI